MTEQYMTEQYIKEQYMTEQYIKEQYMKEQYMKEQYMTEQYMKEQYMKEQYMKEQYMTEQKVYLNNKVNKFGQKRGNLIYKNYIQNYEYVIIDFYNLYCSMINFKKNRHFTTESVLLCIERIMNTTKSNQQIILITKNIFEITNVDITKLTIKYKNLHYILVHDHKFFKSNNKERDDFTCILVYHLLYKKNDKLETNTVIISNDKYSNYKDILTNVKPMILVYTKNGELANIPITSTLIKQHQEYIKDTYLNRIGFYYKKY
jgi:hypothetical protein